MKLEKSERETIICFDEEMETAHVETFNAKLKSKLTKLCKEHEGFNFLGTNMDGMYSFEVPKAYVTINSPRKISDEDRKRRGERLKEAKENIK